MKPVKLQARLEQGQVQGEAQLGMSCGVAAFVWGFTKSLGTTKTVARATREVRCGVQRPRQLTMEGGDGEDAKQARKDAKKRLKAERRAKREGRAEESVGQKSCDLCRRSVDLLIRCQIDETLQWRMVCGKCWKDVSGGVVDGDDAHPYYRYGGLWKNRAKT
mmetsp:Transcript_5559/g.16585  ORF Transcript_5559/g.16585 Transcript_5559/m.16585 type:complete len:162 (+) Transcript_5559:121-606(+)